MGNTQHIFRTELQEKVIRLWDSATVSDTFDIRSLNQALRTASFSQHIDLWILCSPLAINSAICFGVQEFKAQQTKP